MEIEPSTPPDCSPVHVTEQQPHGNACMRCMDCMWLYGLHVAAWDCISFSCIGLHQLQLHVNATMRAWSIGFGSHLEVHRHHMDSYISQYLAPASMHQLAVGTNHTDQSATGTSLHTLPPTIIHSSTIRLFVLSYFVPMGS